MGAFSTLDHAWHLINTTLSLIVALLVALPLFGQDSPDRFSGAVDILLDNGETYHCAMLSESLGPARWRLTFITNVFPDYQSEGFVSVGAHTGGKILIAVVDFGVIVVTPSDRTIRGQFADAIGVVVTTRQRFTMHRITPAETEILIEALE